MMGKGQEWEQAYCQPLYEPLSKNSKEIVCMHEDLCRVNMLATENGLMVIDFEYSAANWALEDLSHMCAIPRES